MSDPAVEAAERAGGSVSSMCHLVAVGSARAALAPIREAYKLWGHPESAEAYAIMAELSELIFTTEELANE